MARNIAYKSPAESKQILTRSARVKKELEQSDKNSESEIDTSKIYLQTEIKLDCGYIGHIYIIYIPYIHIG